MYCADLDRLLPRPFADTPDTRRLGESRPRWPDEGVSSCASHDNTHMSSVYVSTVKIY